MPGCELSEEIVVFILLSILPLASPRQLAHGKSLVNIYGRKDADRVRRKE